MTAVLITGTSSGIARRPDLTVFATARRVDTISHLADEGARLLELDVTDEPSMRAAVAKVEAEHGAVDVLSTTPATANTDRWRRSPAIGPARSSRPTCSA